MNTPKYIWGAFLYENLNKWEDGPFQSYETTYYVATNSMDKFTPLES